MAIDPILARAQVARIVENQNLRLSDRLGRLLTYLSEKSLAGQADELKEYIVGLEAFDKPESYDPRQESVVRMQMGRLRQKLGDYYRTDGADDPILIDLPKGGFKISFIERWPAVVPTTTRRVMRLPWNALLAASIGIVMLGSYSLWVRYSFSSGGRTVQPHVIEADSWTPEMRQLWGPVLASDRPLLVCLATAPPGPSAAGTASGAFRLGQFLASHKQNVLLTRGDQLSMPEIQMDNIVFVGPSAGNRQIDSVPVDREIVLESRGIRNLHPHDGEPKFLADHISSNPQDADESFALVSRTPGLYGHGEIISLSGNQVSSVAAAVQVVTDPTLARTLVSRMKNADGSLPHYFQLVLKIRSMDDMPTDISYVLHRALSDQRSSDNVARR